MYLGIDLGTSGLKAMVIDASQRIVATATSPLAVGRPFPGWSEQDPAAWIEAAEEAIGALAGSAPAAMGCGARDRALRTDARRNRARRR